MIKTLVSALVFAMASLGVASGSALAASPTAPTVATEGSVIPTHSKAKKQKCKKGQVYSKKAKKCVAAKVKKTAPKKPAKPKM